jgi:hypothetical protein
MNARWVLTVAVLAAGLAPAAPAQEIIYQDPHVPGARVGGGQFILTPAETQIVTGAPLFLDQATPTAPGQAPLRVGAAVNGNALGDFGTLPAIFPNLRVDIGFEYLRPVFPGRSVTLVIPSGVNGNFATLAGSGNVSYDFGFIPRITMGYQFPDNPFGLTASGELTNLSGHVTRTIESAAGSANLTATATIAIGVANVIEGSLRVPLDSFAHFQDTCLQDTILLGTIGLRYSHISQDYNASLTSGGNGTTLSAHQDWDGFGLTMSLSYLYPLPRNFFLYGVSRGSFMLGTNNRISTSSVTGSGGSPAGTMSKLTDNKSEFIPVGEFEFGVGWGTPLGKPVGTPPGVPPPDSPAGPILWVKAGFVADVWGDLGLLSSSNGIQGFSDSALFLYGFSVMAGLDF